MTARKHLKHLVRERMRKTGERYTVARRHIVGGDTAWDFRGGLDGETAAFANVLANLGVVAPHTGEPLTEAMVLGVGGGLGAGYILWEFDSLPFRSRVLTLGFRRQWQYERDYRLDALEEAAASPHTFFVKTHGPPLDDGPAIYLTRDGRETLTSYRCYLRDFEDTDATLRDVILGLHGFGCWTDHFHAWRPWERPRTLVLRFEELTANWQSHIPALEEFLGVKLLSHDVPTFAELKQQEPKFYRSGRSDTWKTAFAPDDLELFWALHGETMARLQYGEPPAVDAPRLRSLAAGLRNDLRTAFQEQRHGDARYAKLEQHIQGVQQGVAERDRQLDELRRHIAAAQQQLQLREQTQEQHLRQLAAEAEDRAAKGAVIERLSGELRAVLDDRLAKQADVDRLVVELREVRGDQTAKQALIERLHVELCEVRADQAAKQALLEKQAAELNGAAADRRAAVERLNSELRDVRVDQAAKQALIERQAALLTAMSNDRTAKDAVIARLLRDLELVRADQSAKQQLIDRLSVEVEAIRRDQAAKQDVIDWLAGQLDAVSRPNLVA